MNGYGQIDCVFGGIKLFYTTIAGTGGVGDKTIGRAIGNLEKEILAEMGCLKWRWFLDVRR